MPLVSIIIINYNTFQLTCSCIKSVVEKTKDVSYEIILVDNASTERDADEFKKLFPKINLIKSKENLGFAKGNNVGIQHAHGEFILLLNSDCELTEDSIAICCKEFSEKKNIGVITCKLIYPNGKMQHNCQVFPSTIKIWIEKLRLHKLFSKKIRSSYLQGFYWDYETFGFPDWIWGTFFMFRKSALDLLPDKRLSDDFFMYMEDVQWCWNFRKAKIKIAYTPKTTVIHHGGGSNADRSEMINKNYLSFLEKNYNAIHRKLLGNKI
ncbi:MAG: glycosyltransferase family 2 protein [Bacteroidetes bacterium]|nr:glycosyltransferase family 2 protein [Bacteroidota bacterium]